MWVMLICLLRICNTAVFRPWPSFAPDQVWIRATAVDQQCALLCLDQPHAAFICTQQ